MRIGFIVSYEVTVYSAIVIRFQDVVYKVDTKFDSVDLLSTQLQFRF